jgi:hypothetical protein
LPRQDQDLDQHVRSRRAREGVERGACSVRSSWSSVTPRAGGDVFRQNVIKITYC